MTDADIFLTVKKDLDNFSREYDQIIDTFEQATIHTFDMEETSKNKIRMDALEIRCKNSQFLLNRIIIALSDKCNGLAEIKEYENKVTELLTNIRNELRKNDLLGMIKYLENIAVVMTEIDNKIKTNIEKISMTLH